MKLLILSLLACSAFAQTAVFPGAVVTDKQLPVAVNGIQTALVSGITSTATTMQVGNATGLVANMILSVDSERIWICQVAGTTVTIGKSSCPNVDGRGVDGSSAAAHNSSAVVSAYIDAWHNNAMRQEVKALEQWVFGSTTYSTAYYLAQNPSSTTFGIQEAINAACAATPAGGIVVIPNGTYTGLGSTISITCSNLQLRAQTPLGVTIIRTADFGDSIYINGTGGTLSYVSVVGLLIRQTLNYAAGPPPTIVNKPSSGAQIHLFNCWTCEIRGNQLEPLVYGIDADGVGNTLIENNQINGLWDNLNSNVQVTFANIYLHHSASSAGYPTYLTVRNNIMRNTGYASAPRTITVNGNNITNHIDPVGALYGIWLTSCEACNINNNYIEWDNGSGIHIAALASHSVSDALLDTLIDGNYIDYHRLYCIDFDMTANTSMNTLNFRIQNNRISGSGASINNIYFAPPSVPWTFVRTAANTLIQNNTILYALGSAIMMWSSDRTVITGNAISDYNYVNSFPLNTQTCDATGCSGDRLGNSGVYISGVTLLPQVTNNLIGGSWPGGGYDASTIWTRSGISIGYYSGYGSPKATTAPNKDGGVQAPLSRSTAVNYDPAFLVFPPTVSDGNILDVPTASACVTVNAGSNALSGILTSTTTSTCSFQLVFTPLTATNSVLCTVANASHAASANSVFQVTPLGIHAGNFTGTMVTGDTLTYSCTPN